MTDAPTVKKQYQAHVDEVWRLGPIWQDRMGLGHIDIENVFLDSFDGEPSCDDFHTTAVCEVRWNYMQAKIKWYLPSLVRCAVEGIVRFVVHEYCHILLASEQTLVDAKLEEHIARDGLTEEESKALQTSYYALLEHSTELAARAIMRGWEGE